jgi:hypothetical protein
MAKYVQWSIDSDGDFTPVGKTTNEMPPGYYEIHTRMMGPPYFHRVKIADQQMVCIDGSKASASINNAKAFWERRDLFLKHGRTHKRGFLLYGSPGGGKSTTIREIVKNTIAIGGFGILFKSPGHFRWAYDVIRQMYPDAPVVAVMEDIDKNMSRHETDIIDMMDGLEKLDNVMFLATTNYLDRLPTRIRNRPSRFDRTYEIEFPGNVMRREFLNGLFDGDSFDDKWVTDTVGFSPAHLTELHTSVVLLGGDLDSAITAMKDMINIDKEHNDEDDN